MRDASGSVGRTAGAVLMGLSLAGCPGDGVGPTPEPEYGVPATESNSGEPTEDSGGTSTTGAEESTGGSNDTDETISVGEPEYGVPETDSVGEPEYGVPETDSVGEPDYGVPETSGA